MRYIEGWVRDENDEAVDRVARVFFVISAVTSGISWLFKNILAPKLILLWEWLTSWHFGDFWAASLHLYVWIFLIPLLILFLLGVAIALSFVIFGGVIAWKLASWLFTGDDGLVMVLKFVVGGFLVLFFGAAGLGAGYVLGGGVFKWSVGRIMDATNWVKDNVLFLGWLADGLFLFLLYGVLPGGLLTMFILTHR